MSAFRSLLGAKKTSRIYEYAAWRSPLPVVATRRQSRMRYSRSSLASAPLMTLRVGVMGISAIGTSRSGHLSLATP